MAVESKIGQISQVRANREFYVSERDRAYGDWTTALHREMIQNCVDSGAKNISITIESATGKGVLSRDAECQTVTRIRYEDDGCGMPPEVLENVYFQIQGTTKQNGDSVGGFGRARLMTTFAQPRYAIRTGERWAQGVGSEYALRTVDEAILELEAWEKAARDRATSAAAANDAEAERRHLAVADAHASDRDILINEPLNLNGCRVELDLNPVDGRTPRQYPTVQRMLDTLRSYLETSALKAKVTINGEAWVQEKVVTKAPFKLMASVKTGNIPEGWNNNPKVEILESAGYTKDVVFGEISLVDPAKQNSLPKGRIVVRTSGATMFDISSGDDNHTLILELSPHIAREIMTSNRDALREEYKTALEEFTRRMATDTNEALRGQPRKELSILKGGKGALNSHRAELLRQEKMLREMTFETKVEMPGFASARTRTLATELANANVSTYFDKYDWSGFLENGFDNVPSELFMRFFDEIKAKGSFEGTFLEKRADQNDAKQFLSTMLRHGPCQAMDEASNSFLGQITGNLKLRMAIADDDEAEKNSAKLSDLNDFTILKENSKFDPDRVDAVTARKKQQRFERASRRLDPRHWDLPNGQGLQARKVLAVWQVAVQSMMDISTSVFQNTPRFPYAVGWVLSHPTWSWNSLKQSDGWTNKEACFIKPDDRGDLRCFLLNPLDNDYNLRYGASDSDDRHQIMVSAAHEVAHTYAPDSHNQTFAEVLTEIMAKLTPKKKREINKEMDVSLQLIDRMYNRGKAKVVALDSESGPRPSDCYLDGLTETGSECIDKYDGMKTVDGAALDAVEQSFVPDHPSNQW